MFDFYDEFNEWFFKDIESYVEKQLGIDESKYNGIFVFLFYVSDSF